jgi:acetyl-CoA carboxylase carboxyl transferase subunit alpha
MDYTLEFEKPLQELENQIKELQEANSRSGIDISGEIKALQQKVDKLLREIYSNLSPWERVQLARHPQRPHALDYIENMVDEFHELHGDRRFKDDPSMVTGFGYLDGRKVAVLGIEKGRKTQEKIKRNFGMAGPEGYRKALRVMKLAAQFNIPIITFVDTPGAYPGIGAEERGQAQAIAENLEEMFGIRSPIISVVIGEGGSGGALGVAIADKVLMLEYSVYSVISPESCASILWSDPKKAQTAADSLQLGPNKALELGVIDKIISEPSGGAHRNIPATLQSVKSTLTSELDKLSKLKIDEILNQRFEKFRAMGNQTISTLSDREEDNQGEE